MRQVQEVIEDLEIATGTPSDLLDELFWAALVRGLATGTATWGKLFCDLRGWSKGGDVTSSEAERMTEAEASALVRKVLGEK